MEAHIKVLFLLCFFLLLVNSVLTQEEMPLNSAVERAALLGIRASLGIRAIYWPRRSDPCTNWTGVECQNGRVTGISLYGLRRTVVGRRNPSFAIDALVNCTQLITFNSSRFQLPGPIPDWLGQSLSALQVLDLRSSSVLGPIPPSLGSLIRLNSLLLSDNSLTGIIPDSLGQLVSLSVLNLSHNMLTGSIPSSLSALANLTTLDLSSNFISGPIPPGFGSLLRLQNLNISNNSLTSSVPVQLGNLSLLVELDLGFNSLSGPLPEELGNLRRLQKLLIGNNNLGGAFPGNLALNLPEIRLLDVSGNNLTGNLPDLSAFPNTSTATFNFSNNIFYGRLNSVVVIVELIDISNNYFQGSEPLTENRILISRNCFLRIPEQRSLDDCSVFYALRGLPFDGNPINPVQPRGRRRSSNRLRYILAGVFGGLGVILILGVLLVFIVKLCNKRNVSQRRTANVKPVQENEPGQNASVNLGSLVDSFTYEQMLQATSGFSNASLIKHGHSGDIFSGTLEGGISVVIKKVDMRSSRKDCYMSELEFFSKGIHTRFVPFLGHCLEHETDKLLVYKYMPNGDLSNSLYRSTSLEDDGLQSLDWITRLKIAIGAAEGLSYMHHECNPPLVHGDIQASSILLDDKYDVRLGSLSEVCAQGVDNNQNVITRLLRISSNSEQTPAGPSSPTCAYDVYCFGKVLLELVTGKLGISNNSEDASWLDQTLSSISNYDRELMSKIIDQSLVIDEDLLEEVWAVAIVAKSCLNPKHLKRPQMRHILKALESPFRVVREENFSSERLRNTSSTRSWSAALFGSWSHSHSGSQTNRGDGNNGLKHSGRVNSHGSGTNDRRLSNEVFPEPIEIGDIEKQDENRW